MLFSFGVAPRRKHKQTKQRNQINIEMGGDGGMERDNTNISFLVFSIIPPGDGLDKFIFIDFCLNENAHIRGDGT
jgi:hypothetical protein